MRTGQVAKQAGVNIQTLRYYERRGLLPRPPRRDSGYRTYGPDAVEFVRFLKQAQAQGFSLREAQLIRQHLDQPGGLQQAIERRWRHSELGWWRAFSLSSTTT